MVLFDTHSKGNLSHVMIYLWLNDTSVLASSLIQICSCSPFAGSITSPLKFKGQYLSDVI